MLVSLSGLHFFMGGEGQAGGGGGGGQGQFEYFFASWAGGGQNKFKQKSRGGVKAIFFL